MAVIDPKPNSRALRSESGASLGFEGQGHMSANDNGGLELGGDRAKLIQHINLQLAALGQPPFRGFADHELLDIADDLLKNYAQHKRLLADYRCPADHRIESFLHTYLAQHGIQTDLSMPARTFVLDRAGLARELSLPPDADEFRSECLRSYRVIQGVLHNPVRDRRTTKGVFHIVEGGLPVPADKKAVPVAAYAELLARALNPPEALLTLPFTSSQAEQARVWVSLLLRPYVSPEIAGVLPRKRMETRFFAPGSLVANLDFVERIFGNGGDPFLPENDAGLDPTGWSGHTGCVILAPHLTGLTKRELGLPSRTEATPRQVRDGMCWSQDDELYNDGKPFKIVCRDTRGVIVTIIADNYFGYSKKEIKSQISYAANLFGGCEEEHAGGALAFASYNLGDIFHPDSRVPTEGHTFDDVASMYGELIDVRPEGYGIDRRYPNVIYVAEDTSIDLQQQRVSWTRGDTRHELKLLADYSYIYPCGYKVRMEKHPKAPTWRLIGTVAEGTFCHKPCTVSGGGKSEISKSITTAILAGPLYVRDIDEDLDAVSEIFERDYSHRFRNPPPGMHDSRSLLAADRSLGSVIKLLTPSETEYTDAYNAWLGTIPQHIRALVFIIKRFYRQQWGERWRDNFTVDIVNGYSGNELKYDGRRLVASYLRVGREPEGAWRIFKLRQDFVASDKVQMEDDISVSMTVPADRLQYLGDEHHEPAVKLVENCESMLFQRPDDAIYRGEDWQAEADLAKPGNFISNFEPLSSADARDLVDDAIDFDRYTAPMQGLVLAAAQSATDRYLVSSAHPRVVDGKPSKNMRYLQKRPDLVDARGRHIAEMGTRLKRRIPIEAPVYFPVDAVLPGRRNNPPDLQRKVRTLAVYNPIHYQELPELFMDFIASLTGKSPSTTGAGSEGALTKGPFNSMPATADLNNALVSYILTGHAAFTTAAGYIGAERRVDHDVSYLIPELWCRIPVRNRDPRFLVAHGYLEKLEDFEHDGQTVLASRLGYRITAGFVHSYFGRIFDHPTTVFDEAMLRPETQSLDDFVDGVNNIVEAQRRVAQGYIDDGSIADACPPLQALLEIMATGSHQGRTIDDPDLRAMFTADYLLASSWYQERLRIKQRRDRALWEGHVAYLSTALRNNPSEDPQWLATLEARLAEARAMSERVADPGYIDQLRGTPGADWVHRA